jgi:hypothetical protein
VEIEDEPRFRYRGILLDVARHFYPTDFIKKLIDLLALYKLNTLHLHLTDDQGWRLEIRKYPLLTQVGAWRKETIVGQDFDPYVLSAAPSPLACCPTRACSRRTGRAPSSVRAQRSDGALRTVRLCGRGPDRLQLMRMSVGGHAGIRVTPAFA